MKRFLLLMLMVILMVGCSDDSDSDDSDNDDVSAEAREEENEKQEDEEESNTVEEADEESETDSQEDRNEERYGGLQEVGETTEDSTGKRELINVKRLDETIEHGSIEIDMVNVKILEWSDLDQQSLNYLQSELGTEQETFQYLQVVFNAKNNSDQDVDWGGMETIVADEQQIDAHVEGLFGTVVGPNIYAGTEDRYTFGYVLSDGEVENLRIMFSSVTELNSFDIIEDQNEYNVEFD